MIMMTAFAGDMPAVRPVDARFSPGPTRKFEGWTPGHVGNADHGRSHRSKPVRTKLKDIISRSKALLGMPDDWRLGIVPGSDTGAVEIALWNLFGARPAEFLVWESFGKDWATDALDQLKIDAKITQAPYGELPDLHSVDWNKDVCLTWNGTTSGVRMPSGEAIPDDREGLVLADATSAAYAMDLPWDKLDVVTWSWQKVLGGEAAHGMLALSPRAVARIAEYKPAWPIPKIYRIRKGSGVNEALFEGATLNTPSLLAVEDQLAALAWAENLGGLPVLKQRSLANLAVVEEWIARTPWAEFMCREAVNRSSTAICIRISDPEFDTLPDDASKWAFVKKMTALLDEQGVAFDIDGYRDAPPSIRIWGGGTVETPDIVALMPWLDWAFARVKANL